MKLTLYMLKKYTVNFKFDLDKDYGIHIRKQCRDCLSVMKVDDIITIHFIKEHLNEFTIRNNTYSANLAAIQKSIVYGKKIGMLTEIANNVEPILYKDFCDLESVSYYRSQLRAGNRVNTKAQTDGTRETYTRHLYYFNTWLYQKTIEYSVDYQTGIDTFTRKNESIIIDGIDQLLKLYATSHDRKPFEKLIKRFFLSDEMKKKGDSARNVSFFAIGEFFKKNDEPINLTFDPNAGFQPDGDSEQIMTLDEFFQLLTTGKPSITEKAVFLCKFQRGLDVSTLVDRFNFEVYPILLDAFGSDDYTAWNLKKCPILVKLRRVKRNYLHSGFLDRDAIVSIIEYMKYREKLTSEKMKAGKALFLNKFCNPIGDGWMLKSFDRMRRTAGLDIIINERKVQKGSKNKYKFSSHEVRDLLKSVLLECGVRAYVADEVIGHNSSDSYDKSKELFPETLRKEYSKASDKINIFSKFRDFSLGIEDDNLKQRIAELELTQRKMNKRIERTSKLVKESKPE